MATTHELYTGPGGVPGNYGMGQRVPMTVISPWSKGGWVCSENFDHTSIIRFMEKRFGVREPNITPWRRAVSGDLTSAFDLSGTNTTVPTLPATAAYRPTDDKRHDDYVPVPPPDPRVPRQEPGVRPSRPLGYEIDLRAAVTATGFGVHIMNRGKLGAQLQARSVTLAGAPFSYTVGRRSSLSPSWALPTGADYDVSFHGPNGFFRRFAGTVAPTGVEVTATFDGDDLVLAVANGGARSVQVKLANAYDGGKAHSFALAAGRTHHARVGTTRTGGWYDVVLTLAGTETFQRVFAGRIENGRPGTSDPQLGRR